MCLWVTDGGTVFGVNIIPGAAMGGQAQPVGLGGSCAGHCSAADALPGTLPHSPLPRGPIDIVQSPTCGPGVGTERRGRHLDVLRRRAHRARFDRPAVTPYTSSPSERPDAVRRIYEGGGGEVSKGWRWAGAGWPCDGCPPPNSYRATHRRPPPLRPLSSGDRGLAATLIRFPVAILTPRRRGSLLGLCHSSPAQGPPPAADQTPLFGALHRPTHPPTGGAPSRALPSGVAAGPSQPWSRVPVPPWSALVTPSRCGGKPALCHCRPQVWPPLAAQQRRSLWVDGPWPRIPRHPPGQMPGQVAVAQSM